MEKKKKLGKIKLNQLSKDELDKRALNSLKGGCACMYNYGYCNCADSYYSIYYIYNAVDARFDRIDVATY